MLCRILDFCEDLKNCDYSESAIKEFENAGFRIGGLVEIVDDIAYTLGTPRVGFGKTGLILKEVSSIFE